MIRRTGLLDRSRQQRDAALHHVATEDSHGPGAYFAALETLGITDSLRVRVVTVPTPAEGGRSSPLDVVARLREHLRQLDRVAPFDGRWVLIDVDHHFEGRHQRNLAGALQEAASLSAEVLVSNPCFEAWLLLHVADVTEPLGTADATQAALTAHRPEWRKDRIGALRLTRAAVEDAVARTRRAPPGLVPPDPGSTVWRLVERLLG